MVYVARWVVFFAYLTWRSDECLPRSILFAAYVLPSAMGIKLNTPADTPADGTLLLTWTPAATDPYVPASI
jgi:hypothetical protein